MDYGRKRGYDDMRGYDNMGGTGYGMEMGMGGGIPNLMSLDTPTMGSISGGYTSREHVTDTRLRRKIYCQMTLEGSRGESRRRDADDFDPESMIMRKLFVRGLD
jgi:hypothetical protein